MTKKEYEADIYRNLLSEISRYGTLYNIPESEIARTIGKSAQTYASRLRNPETFLLKELEAIAEKFNKKLKIIFETPPES